MILGELLEIVGAPREGDCTWCEARHSGDGERAFLVKTCFLVMQGSDTLSGCSNVDYGGRQLLDTTEKYPVVSCPSHLPY